ncbi:MAG: AAA family ATPase [Pseudomonadota bacterium]
MIHDLLEARGFRLKKDGGNRVTSPCPVCKDGEDRFVIWTDKNRAWCRRCGWAGDDIQLLIDVDGLSFQEAIEKAGRTEKLRDIAPAKKDAKIVANYNYVDEDGELLYQVIRFDPKDFRQRRPGTGTTRWMNNLKDTRLVLYDLPNVIEAKAVCLVEGEGKVRALKKIDIPATCNPMGAGKLKSQQEEHQILEPLRGKQVYIFPDNDPPGKAHAEEAATLLKDIALQIKIVNLRGLPAKGDVVDFIEKRECDVTSPRDQIIRAIKEAEIWRPPRDFFTLEELEEMVPVSENHVPIFRYGYWNYGEHIIVAGAGGVGKSLLVLEWALYIAAGENWLNILKTPRARKVHVMQWENSVREVMLDRAKRMKKGMQAKGIDVSGISKRLSFNKRNQYFDLKLKGDHQKLLEAVKSSEAEVIIYDCLSNMHSGNENDNSFMAGILDVIGNINATLGTSSLVVHHYNKPSNDPNQPQVNTGYRLRGATRIRDWARTLFLYVEEPHRTEVFRRLIMDKCNSGRPFRPLLLVRNDPIDPPPDVDKDEWVDPDATFLCEVSTESKLCSPLALQELVEKYAPEGKGLTSTEFWEIVEEEIGCGKSSFYRSLKTATLGKYLKKISKGKGVRYFSPFQKADD